LPVLGEIRDEARLRRRRWRGVRAFLFGLIAGFATLVAAALLFGHGG
jgi:hypothetical protein